MNSKVELSVVIPVSERFDDLVQLVGAYSTGLNRLDLSYEFVFVLDGQFPDVRSRLESLMVRAPVTIVQLARWFGEATAITAGVEQANADLVLTLPAYFQVEAERVDEIVRPVRDGSVDMAIGNRWPRTDAKINQLQARLFHWIFNALTGSKYHDLGCGVRAFRRVVAEEVPLYGDQHRFFPVLAARAGFTVAEVALPQSTSERSRRVYGVGVYVRRLLDIVTMLFLLKFTRKPLRFFGLIGTAIFAGGGVVLAYVVTQRLFFGVPLADRPALLLSAMLIVVGLQLFALGLIGELIIFTHAREIKEYRIAEIVN